MTGAACCLCCLDYVGLAPGKVYSGQARYMGICTMTQRQEPKKLSLTSIHDWGKHTQFQTRNKGSISFAWQGSQGMIMYSSGSAARL
jgi:hypothetical protein